MGRVTLRLGRDVLQHDPVRNLYRPVDIRAHLEEHHGQTDLAGLVLWELHDTHHAQGPHTHGKVRRSYARRG